MAWVDMKPLDDLKKLHESTTKEAFYNDKIKINSCNDFVWGHENVSIEEWDEYFIIESHKMVPRLIKALEKCMEQRNLLINTLESEIHKYSPDVKEKGYIYHVSEVNKELEQILEGK